MKKIDKILVMVIAGVSFLFALIVIYTEKPAPPRHRPTTINWIESQLKINYQNGIVDTVVIDVYESLDQIQLKDGTLSYLKCTKRTGGIVATTINLCSYVRSYEILKSENKSLTK